MGLYERHIGAASRIRITSTTPGSAAELVASRKVTKYADHLATHIFVPVAMYPLGPMNKAGL